MAVLGINRAQATLAADYFSNQLFRYKAIISLALLAMFVGIGMDILKQVVKLPQPEALEGDEIDLTKVLIEEREKSDGVKLIVIASHETIKDHQQVILSQKCYAQRHGYEHYILDPDHYTACKKYQILEYRKICALKTYLESEPDNLNVLVLDEFTLGNIENTNLDNWLIENADFVVFEHVDTFEWSHDTYMLKNSEFIREFLKNWADYEYIHPAATNGETSFTNGNGASLHLNLVNYIGLKDTDVCQQIFQTKLNAPAIVKMGELNPGPYSNLVGCTRKLAGPERSWIVPDRDEFGIHKRKFSIYARFMGWSVNAQVLNYVPGGFHPFHTVKLEGNTTWSQVNQLYNFEFDVNHDASEEGRTEIKCHSNAEQHDLSTLGQAAKTIEDGLVRTPINQAYHKVPRWTQAKRCFESFDCRPWHQDKIVNVLPFLYGNEEMNMKVTHYTPTYYEGVPARKFKDSHTK